MTLELALAISIVGASAVGLLALQRGMRAFADALAFAGLVFACLLLLLMSLGGG